MAKEKAENKQTENNHSRQVAFNKRSTGLIKKANELAILCEAEVAVIGYSNTGKRFEFSSSSVEQTLSRYEQCRRRLEKSTFEVDPGVADETNCGQTIAELNLTHAVTETNILKEQVMELKQKQSLLMAKDPCPLDIKELQQQEQRLNEALLAVNERKEKILMKQLEQARANEYRAIAVNEALLKQVAELRRLVPTEETQPQSREYFPLSNNSLNEAAGGRPDTLYNNGVEIGDSDTILQLGLPSGNFV